MKNQNMSPNSPNSALNWYPRLKSTGVKTPKTIFIPLNHEEGYGGDCPVTWNTEDVINTIPQLNGPPVFIRTDLSSEKHKIDKASKLTSTDKGKIDKKIFELITSNEMKGTPENPMLSLPYKCLMIREWLDLWYLFRGFVGGLKIAAERRAFIRDGEHECDHFYWVKESIAKWEANAKETIALAKEIGTDPDVKTPPKNWKERLKKTKKKTEEHKESMMKELEKVTEEFDEGYWSVDFALTEDEEWYVIDMAKGKDSHHKSECEFNQE